MDCVWTMECRFLSNCASNVKSQLVLISVRDDQCFHAKREKDDMRAHLHRGQKATTNKQAKMENAASRLDSPTHNVHYKKARAIDLCLLINGFDQ